MLKINKKVFSILLGPVVLLTGCGPKSECSEMDYHLHKYKNDETGMIKYVASEYLSEGYNFYWTDEKVFVSIKNETLYDFERKHRLMKIEDNIEQLEILMKDQKDFTEYRYKFKYTVTETKHKTDSDGNEKIITKEIEKIGYSWTKDKKHKNLTGETRKCRYSYYGCKIVQNKKGKYKLVKSEKVFNINDIKDEYPYLTVNFCNIIDEKTGMTPYYEDRDREQNQNSLLNYEVYDDAKTLVYR